MKLSVYFFSLLFVFSHFSGAERVSSHHKGIRRFRHNDDDIYSSKISQASLQALYGVPPDDILNFEAPDYPDYAASSEETHDPDTVVYFDSIPDYPDYYEGATSHTTSDDSHYEGTATSDSHGGAASSESHEGATSSDSHEGAATSDSQDKKIQKEFLLAKILKKV